MKTNHLFSFCLTLCLAVFSLNLPAQEAASDGSNLAPVSALIGSAGGVAGALTSAATHAWRGVDSCGDTLPVKFSELRLLGRPLTATYVRCQRGEATVNGQCGTNWVTLNPLNPQYLTQELLNSREALRTLASGASIDRNPSRMYFCVQGLPGGGGFKREYCRNIAQQVYPDFQFTWSALRGRDGTCYCSRGVGTRSTECPNGNNGLNLDALMEELAPQACREIGLVGDERPRDQLSAAERRQSFCRCTADGPYVAIEGARERCEEIRATSAVVPAASEDATVAATPTAASDATRVADLRTCVDAWFEHSSQCKASAESANTSCQAREQNNRPLNAAAASVSALNQAVVGNNTGAGTQSTCFETGVLTAGATEVLGAARETCNTEFAACERQCPQSSFDDFLQACSQKMGMSPTELRNDTTDRTNYYRSKAALIEENFNTGIRLCTHEARSNRISLENLTTGAARSLQASARCACQTSSSNGTNCGEIPTIDVCQSNGATSAGCNLYQSMGSCVVGSPNYDSAACACARNPSAAGCTQTTAVAANIVSNFGGAAPVASAGGGGVSGFAGGGGSGGSSGGGSFSDLGGLGSADPASAILANNLKGGEAPPAGGGGAAGASVGGGSGGGGGSPTDPAAPPVEKPSKLKDMFNDLKTTVSRALFGNGKAKKPVQAAANPGDVSRFKPANMKLRGGPIQRDIASANEKTIFELVNDCANGLRCKSTTTNEMLTEP